VRMANIAQMINVLQAMILTEREKMILTPTYYVFKMYVPFQDAAFVPVSMDAGAFTQGGISLPRIDAIAAKAADGKLLLEITNLDAENPVIVDADMPGITAKSASAETLTGAAVDSINTFASPNTVVPKSTAVKIKDGKLSLTVAPRSVTIVSIEP
jgi:alpha-N-arabinofuranosidase